MENQIFRFKQFEINQSKCAMKIGTDGVLLGAWADVSNCRRILDIGTGTGLLALMMAQRSNANITAVEIEKDAAIQASNNFLKSSWNSRLEAIHSNIEDLRTDIKFDFIICNPPFFKPTAKETTEQRLIARQSVSLTSKVLLEAVASHMSTNGMFACILPVEESKELICLANCFDIHLTRLAKVRPTPSKLPHRYLMEFETTQRDCIASELIIEEFGRHGYSKEYIELTSDFYMFM